jgi:D-arginine dehydrogenase
MALASDLQGFDIAVIGAGIAGASAAAELSAHARVVLVEREAQPGYHTTGRSAALFSETYGPAPIRALSRASGVFFRDPPAGFAQHPLLHPRGVLMVARADQAESIERFLEDIALHGSGRRLGADEALAMMPLLKPSYVAQAVLEHGASDIDVHGLHHGYLRRFRENSGTLLTGAEVLALGRTGDGWRIETSQGELAAGIVVDAAGAWADELGAMAGALPIGLVPKRRTALMVAAPDGVDPNPWPMAVDIDEQFYLKPDAGRLLLSPADETPSPPCDAQPEELDIAICIDKVETAFDLKISRIENKWAGLRSFVEDGVPVAGYDRRAKDFFWLAGQGGYGIQSGPALARFAAAMILGKPVPADILDQGLDPATLSPERLGASK